MLDTSNWATYPFEVDGVQFVSKISKDGSFYPQISQMPIAMVNLMNESAIREIVGDITKLSYSELQSEMDRINEGATQALICLA